VKELSLNILDITENSVKAGATLTSILLDEDDDQLVLSIVDNGSGMSEEILKGVTDPFYTTRTTRKVGMGLPLLKLAAEQTGGSMSVESVSVDDDPVNHGTKVRAVFNKNNIDFTPLGDVVLTITTLIQGHPDTDFLFRHDIRTREKEVQVELDTREVREILEGVPLNEYEVISWIGDYLNEQYNGPDDTE